MTIVALSTSPDLKRGVCLQITPSDFKAGDVLTIRHGPDADTAAIVQVSAMALQIALGDFIIHLRPWRLSDGRMASWPADAARWTVESVRPR